jgi:hypothetical protein
MSDSAIAHGDEGLMRQTLAALQERWRSIARALGLADVNRGEALKAGGIYLLSLTMIVYPLVTFLMALRSKILLISLPLLLTFLAGLFGMQIALRWRG